MEVMAILPFNQPEMPDGVEVEVLADYFEVLALVTNTRISEGKVQTELRREHGDKGDAIAADVWALIRARSTRFAPHWPMTISNDRLVGPSDTGTAALHYFMCVLSIGDSIDKNGRKLFEECVTELAAIIACGEAICMGHPRRTPMQASFRKAVKQYANMTHEHALGASAGYPGGDDQDLGMDVATWIRFGDDRGGWLHLIGQCATGRGWRKKLSELRGKLQSWKRNVLNWVLEPSLFFATCQVVPDYYWTRSCEEGGLILDRPRLYELHDTKRIGAAQQKAVEDYCEALYG